MTKAKSSTLTMEQAWDVAHKLAETFHVAIVDHKQAEKLSTVTRLLSAVIPAAAKIEEVIREFSTSLGVFVLISDEARKTPLGVIRHVVHQIEHVTQRTDGRFEALWLYTTSPEARARMEAHAYASELEVAFYLTGVIPTMDELIWPLEGIYALGDEHKRLARQILEARVTAMVHGAVGGVGAAEAIRLFQVAGVERTPHKPTPPVPEGTAGA